MSKSSSETGSEILVAPHPDFKENIFTWLSQSHEPTLGDSDTDDHDVPKTRSFFEEDEDDFRVEEMDEFELSCLKDARRQRIHRRDKDICLLCGQSGDSLCHALRSNTNDRQALGWLHDRSLVPISFVLDDENNIFTLCDTHHVEWAMGLFCFIPTQKDLAILLEHEHSDYQMRQAVAAKGHSPPSRTLPKLSGLFTFFNINMPQPYLTQHVGTYKSPLLFDISNCSPSQSSIPPLTKEFSLPIDPMALIVHAFNLIVESPRPFSLQVIQVYDVLDDLITAYSRPDPLEHSAQPLQSKEQTLRKQVLASSQSYWRLGPHLSANDAVMMISQQHTQNSELEDDTPSQDMQGPWDV